MAEWVGQPLPAFRARTVGSATSQSASELLRTRGGGKAAVVHFYNSG